MFPFYGMQQHATTHQFQALKVRPLKSPAHRRRPRSTHACSKLTDTTTRVPETVTQINATGLQCLHESARTCIQITRLVFNGFSLYQQKKKALHKVLYIYLFISRASILYIYFLCKWFGCLMANISFQKEKEKKNTCKWQVSFKKKKKKKCSSEKYPTLPLQSCFVMHSVCYCEDFRAGATVVCIFFNHYLLCTYRRNTRGPFGCL